jgi:cell wall-associated NlpC family hydrolase
MRFPLRRLKIPILGADHRTMAPGGRSRSRRARMVAVAFAIGLTLLPATSAFAAPPGYTSGDEGSGMPSTRVVYPDDPRGTRSLVGGSVRFSDVDASYSWASAAIAYVAGTNDWMRDFAALDDGTYPFRPDAIATRKYFARSVVKAFAPSQQPDPSIVFTDLDPSTPWYRYAAVAVQNGWMTRTKDGAFLPDKAVTVTMAHRALVLALGLKPAAKALDRISTSSGFRFEVPKNFGTTQLGLRLFLRYNAPTGSESMDLAPRDKMPRSQVAYSLFRAKTQPSWTVPELLRQYASVTLPHLGPRQRAIVQWGIGYVGYPYVWGGEWGFESPAPPGLGGQPRSGFDCTGLVWWLVRANDTYAWQIAPPRPYAGWSLPQRTSADMARMTTTRLTFDELQPGDIGFYDGNKDGVVDHANVYIGNGYALDSSSTPAGVTIMWVGDRWYRDHFKYGRRVLPS